jgi:type IV pilus assembly protein PilE
MKRALQSARGFTLMEMMIAVAVIGILAAVAYPSYVNQLRQSRRTDAKVALLDLAARQERYFSVNNVYATTPQSLGYAKAEFPVDVLSGSTAYYQLRTQIGAGATSFTATAVPVGAQERDVCGSYAIDHLGVQTNSHSHANSGLSAERCW